MALKTMRRAAALDVNVDLPPDACSGENATSVCQVGQRVQLKGLVKKAALNGCAGVLIWWDQELGRWLVQLDQEPPGVYQRVLIQNIEPITAGSMQQACPDRAPHPDVPVQSLPPSCAGKDFLELREHCTNTPEVQQASASIPADEHKRKAPDAQEAQEAQQAQQAQEEAASP